MRLSTLVLSATVLAAPNAAAQVVYATDDAGAADNHFLDVPSGVSTSGLWTNGESWGLADDDANGVMYIADGSTLVSWPYNDPNPATTVGTFNDAGRTLVPIGLGYDNGMLLGFDNDALGNEGYWDVDVVTGNATLHYAASQTAAEWGGVDIDPATGLVYNSQDTTSFTDSNGVGGRGIIEVDTVNAMEINVGPYPSGVTDIDGLALDPAGVVWLLEDEPAPLHNFDLGTMTYDPTPPMNAIPASEVFSAGTYTAVFTPGGDLGTNYCTANPNSSGAAASMSASGSDVVADNDFHLHCSDMPLNSNGYFLNSMSQDFVMNPGGSQGNLCLGNPVGRFDQQVQNSGGTGEITIMTDLTAFPTPTGAVAVMAGETWNFSCWFRDTDGMGNATSNFADGLEVLFN